MMLRRSASAASENGALLSLPRFLLRSTHHPNSDAVASLLSYEFCTASKKNWDLGIGKPNQLEKFAREQSKYGFTCLDDALNLFREMVRMRPTPSTKKFNQLLSAIARTKHYEAVISLVRQLDLLGTNMFKPDVYTHTIAINCFCHLKIVDFGFSLLGKTIKLGLEPNLATFNTLIRGLCSDGKLAEATKLFHEIVAKGFHPDMITYGTIINGLCKVGNTNTAIAVLRKMEEIESCPLNIAIYSTIIDSLWKDRRLPEALNLFDEMVGKGILPNVVTFTSLIQGTCSLGQWNQTRRLLKEMIARNIVPNVQTFSILIDGYCKADMIAEAFRVLQVMIKRGVEPNVVAYNSLMDAYCLIGRMKDARKVFNVMISQGLAPDAFSYSILINGYFKSKLINEALKLFRKMSHSKVTCDTVTYSNLIGGLCRAHRPQAALLVFKEMQTNGQIPDLITYRVLLDGLFKNQLLDDAVGLFKTIENFFS